MRGQFDFFEIHPDTREMLKRRIHYDIPLEPRLQRDSDANKWPKTSPDSIAFVISLEHKAEKRYSIRPRFESVFFTNPEGALIEMIESSGDYFAMKGKQGLVYRLYHHPQK